MCGIVGYLGDARAYPILIDALKKLEYRGYDSAGLAVVRNGQVQVRRASGKLINLVHSLDSEPLSGDYGIGHTRWATHGRPTEENAHPHRDCSGKIMVVHNGIIENYRTLRAFLESKGIRLTSETDTEVLAKLIGHFYAGDLEAALSIAERELGYGAALQTGYRYALRHAYDAVLQLDADGQHDPASIPPLLRGLEHADVVVGSRFLEPGSYTPPLARRLGMWLFGTVASAMAGQRITDPTSGFQAISRAALRFYAHERYPVDYPDADVLAMVARSGLRLAEVPVRMLASPDGKSMHAGVLKPLYYVFRMSLALGLVLLRGEKHR